MRSCIPTCFGMHHMVLPCKWLTFMIENIVMQTALNKQGFAQFPILNGTVFPHSKHKARALCLCLSMGPTSVFTSNRVPCLIENPGSLFKCMDKGHQILNLSRCMNFHKTHSSGKLNDHSHYIYLNIVPRLTI